MLSSGRSLTNDILSHERKALIFSIALNNIQKRREIPQSCDSSSIYEMRAFIIKTRANMMKVDEELVKLQASMDVNACENIARHLETVLDDDMLNRLLKNNDFEIAKKILPIFFKNSSKLDNNQTNKLQILIALHTKMELSRHAASFYLHCLKKEEDISVKLKAFIEGAKNGTPINEEVIFPALDLASLTEEEYIQIYCYTLVLINKLNEVTVDSETDISGFHPANSDLSLMLKKLNISDDDYKKFYNKLKEFKDRFDTLKKVTDLISNPECIKILKSYTFQQQKAEKQSVIRAASDGAGGIIQKVPKHRNVPSLFPPHKPKVIKNTNYVEGIGLLSTSQSSPTLVVEERGRTVDKTNGPRGSRSKSR